MSDPTFSQPPADRRVKIPHLVFGLLFLGVAAIWALGESNVIDGERLAILGPGVLIAAGVVGLVASLASGRNRRRAAATYEPANDDTTGYDTTSYDASGYDTTRAPETDTTDHAVTDDDEHTQETR